MSVRIDEVKAFGKAWDDILDALLIDSAGRFSRKLSDEGLIDRSLATVLMRSNPSEGDINRLLGALDARLRVFPSNIDKILSVMKSFNSLREIAVQIESSIGRTASSGFTTEQPDDDEILQTLAYPPKRAADLDNYVGTHVCAKWMSIGRQLDIPQNDLDSIQLQTHQTKECFMRVMSLWYQKANIPYTWAEIIKVLETPSVNERALGSDLRKKLSCRSQNEM